MKRTRAHHAKTVQFNTYIYKIMNTKLLLFHSIRDNVGKIVISYDLSLGEHLDMF